MNKAALFFLAMALFSGQNSAAQLAKLSKLPDGERRWIAGLSSRTSYYVNEPARLTGVYAGLSFENKLRLTTSWNFVRRANAPTEFKTEAFFHGKRRLEETFSMRFLGIGADFIVFNKNRWQVSIPILMGMGAARVDYKLISELSGAYHIENGTQKSLVIPLEGAATAQYKLLDWLGLKASLGNRIAIGKGHVNAVFSGPYWQYGVLLYPAVIYEKTTGHPFKAKDWL